MTPSNSPPLQKSDDEQALLSEISRLYSNRERAEKRIRRVGLFEQRVIAPSIDELQYAGKQMDCALECVNANDFVKAREHLEQADENITKASYDAIDGAVEFVESEMHSYADDLGYANLNEQFGHYQGLFGALIRLKRHIASAGANREQRDEAYRDIAEGADFEALQNYFDELRGSAPAIRASIARNNRRDRISVILPPALTVAVTVILSVINIILNS